MKFIKKILALLTIVLLYLILKEMIQLLQFSFGLSNIFGFIILVILLSFITFFIIKPIVDILRIPKIRGPVIIKKEEDSLIKERLKQFKQNEYLLKSYGDNIRYSSNKDDYNKIIELFKVESSSIREKYVSKLFYGSAISQNGFLDAILILSASIGVIKETFELYNGRVSNKDLLTIGKKVYYSMAIGGSEGVEIVTEEVVSSLSSNVLKSIPFVDKILGSISDGFVNAALLARISLITENYCAMTLIESEKDLYPTPAFIISTVKMITSDITKQIRSVLVNYNAEKIDFPMLALNPVGYLVNKAFDKTISKTNTIDEKKKEYFKDAIMTVGNPFGAGYNILKAARIIKEKYKQKDKNV